MNLGEIRSSVINLGYTADTNDTLNDFINSIYREIHSKERWPFLEAIDNSLNTKVGVSSYLLPMSNWRNIDAVRIAQPGSQNFVKMDYENPQDFFDQWFMAQNETATPEKWTFYANELWFYPVPDGAYQVTIYYIIEPLDLEADTDVPLIPNAFHDVLVWGAVESCALRQRDWIGLELVTAKKEKLVTRLEEEYRLRQRQTSSEVKRSGYWNTEVNYPLSSTGF